jgi:GNAT superfamily N-acetyltransferase
MYWVGVVDGVDCRKYEGLTFPALGTLLSPDSSDRSPIAIGATFFSRPVGLVLITRDSEGTSAVAQSIYVKPGFRNLGLGTELLRCLERSLREELCRTVSLTYHSVKPTTVALERVLGKCEWEVLRTKLLVYESSFAKIAQAPWMLKPARLADRMDIIPWSDITDADRRAIVQSQQAAPWIPEGLIPSEWENEAFEPLTSLGLRYNKEVVGWIINHQVPPGSLRFSCAWTKPGLPQAGVLPPFVALLKESIRRAAEVGFSFGTWFVPIRLRSMAGFSMRCLKPYSLSYGELRMAEKKLA